MLDIFAFINKEKGGFTLMELIVYTGIFTIVVISFIGILVFVTRVGVRQLAVAEVAGQSQFLLQTIQRNVESASLIEMDPDSATSTLRLRVAESSEDPLTILLQGETVYMRKTDGGSLEALTNDKVDVSDLSFTKRENAGGHDSVEVNFTISYRSPRVGESFSQMLDTSVARVSAATFDSNIVPGSAATYKIGNSAGDWQSINNTIYFSGSNVGIGVSNPGAELEINGGLRLNTTVGRPTCDSSYRGGLWVTLNTSATDTVSACLRHSDDSTFSWIDLN